MSTFGKWTEADVARYNARNGSQKYSLIEPTEGVEHESDLHDEIEKHCKQQGWIAFHGSMAHRAMRTIGENDFHCLLPGGVVIFIECKTKKGKLSPEQLGISLWMEKLGHKLHVVRSLQDFLTVVQSISLAKPADISRSFPTKAG